MGVNLVLTILIYYAAFQYLSPLVNTTLEYRKKKFSLINPEYSLIELSTIPINILNIISKTQEKLSEEGFNKEVFLYQSSPFSEFEVYIMVLVNKENKDRAIIITYNNKLTNEVFNYINYCSTYEDGSELNTVNKPHGIFNASNEDNTYRLPSFKDHKELYNIHKKLEQNFFKNQKKMLPTPGREIYEFSRTDLRFLDRQKESGMLYIDSKDNAYKYTWKAAFLSSISQFRLIENIEQQQIREKEKEILRLIS